MKKINPKEFPIITKFSHECTNEYEKVYIERMNSCTSIYV